MKRILYLPMVFLLLFVAQVQVTAQNQIPPDVQWTKKNYPKTYETIRLQAIDSFDKPETIKFAIADECSSFHQYIDYTKQYGSRKEFWNIANRYVSDYADGDVRECRKKYKNDARTACYRTTWFLVMLRLKDDWNKVLQKDKKKENFHPY